MLKSNKVIGVFDVCDEVKAQYHKERIEHFVKDGFTEAQKYWEKYRNLDNLFYPRTFFEGTANEFGLQLEFSPPNGPKLWRLRSSI